ncbi:translation initiation factor IF-2-like [Marmota marmota marmota]|uniref:translation initiation factor IF-2-like n=1 Tax=Marmota marmota marmota TaxID=9994 RepID=UPI002092FFBB|nr:translation initiation factor IF-2-like [Marmota marmota marmota]
MVCGEAAVAERKKLKSARAGCKSKRPTFLSSCVVSDQCLALSDPLCHSGKSAEARSQGTLLRLQLPLPSLPGLWARGEAQQGLQSRRGRGPGSSQAQVAEGKLEAGVLLAVGTLPAPLPSPCPAAPSFSSRGDPSSFRPPPAPLLGSSAGQPHPVLAHRCSPLLPQLEQGSPQQLPPGSLVSREWPTPAGAGLHTPTRHPARRSPAGHGEEAAGGRPAQQCTCPRSESTQREEDTGLWGGACGLSGRCRQVQAGGPGTPSRPLGKSPHTPRTGPSGRTPVRAAPSQGRPCRCDWQAGGWRGSAGLGDPPRGLGRGPGPAPGG